MHTYYIFKNIIFGEAKDNYNLLLTLSIYMLFIVPMDKKRASPIRSDTCENCWTFYIGGLDKLCAP